jgi:hypothetical protein
VYAATACSTVIAFARIDHATVGKPARDRHADIVQRFERPHRIVRRQCQRNAARSRLAAG